MLFKSVMVQTGNPAGILSDLMHKANKLRLWALGLVLYLVQAVESSSDSGLVLLVARLVIWFVKMLTQWQNKVFIVGVQLGSVFMSYSLPDL